uniref:Murine leukemia virus integrase C-terminal domain-containing protein n=1 Tax=Micrurus carvalhoi TaxID=3147026 RepID=A0A2H6NEJ8_9SAUR
MEMVQELNKQIEKLRNYVLGQTPPRLVIKCHTFQPGDRVWVKHWKKEQLEGRWKGSYVVIMSSPLAIKNAESKTWIHWTRVKRAADEEWAVQPTRHPLKVKLTRK